MLTARFQFNGRIAQLVEQLTLNQRVLGSSPSASTINYLAIFDTTASKRAYIWARMSRIATNAKQTELSATP